MRILEFFKRKKKKQNIEYVYNEQDTYCDKCEYLEICKEKGKVFESTLLDDMRRHFNKLPSDELCDDEKEQILFDADKIRAENGCRFCNNKKHGNFTFKGKEVRIFVEDKSSEIFYIDVEFCPMCGRKLVQR